VGGDEGSEETLPSESFMSTTMNIHKHGRRWETTSYQRRSRPSTQ